MFDTDDLAIIEWALGVYARHLRKKARRVPHFDVKHSIRQRAREADRLLLRVREAQYAPREKTG